ncbi:MAG TPA: type II toxin-antitoxin system VapB family antitoxin [Solirubrobacteraceae bacterium]
MALNIKNPEVERLAAELASLTGESKTETVRRALRERRDRLALDTGHDGARATRLLRVLEQEIWPQVPAGELGRESLGRAGRESLLGYGPEGV